MALNAFYNNPAIVGFGNENSVGGSGAATASQQTNDAFSQILKELVDNAVDSCREAILSRHPDQPSCSVTIRIDASGTDGVLRVTVGDNGVGIADLGTAVQAWKSTKTPTPPPPPPARPPLMSTSPLSPSLPQCSATTDCSSQEDLALSSQKNSTSSGRYGLGLPLSILHSFKKTGLPTTISTSSVSNPFLSVCGSFAPNMDRDVIEVLSVSHVFKSVPSCGTMVTLHLLTPPETEVCRLVEYVSRFHLLPDCGVSVTFLAPTLCKLPIQTRMPQQIQGGAASIVSGLHSRMAAGVRSYLGHHTTSGIPLSKVAVSICNQGQHAATPFTLEVCIAIDDCADGLRATSRSSSDIVASLVPGVNALGLLAARLRSEDLGEEGETGEDDRCDSRHATRSSLVGGGGGTSATLRVVRLLNNCPLLDGHDILACAIVKQVPKCLAWKEYGLLIVPRAWEEDECVGAGGSEDFSCHDEEGDASSRSSSPPFLPTFDVQDLAKGYIEGGWGCSEKHSIMRRGVEGEGGCDNDESNSVQFLPAGLRLRNLLLTVHVKCPPSSLQLPTLSKSRFPSCHPSLPLLLSSGVSAALAALAKQNPGLLMTEGEAKRIIRDRRDVEAAGEAIANIVFRKEDGRFRDRMLRAAGLLGVGDGDGVEVEGDSDEEGSLGASGEVDLSMYLDPSTSSFLPPPPPTRSALASVVKTLLKGCISRAETSTRGGGAAGRARKAQGGSGEGGGRERGKRSRGGEDEGTETPASRRVDMTSASASTPPSSRASAAHAPLGTPRLRLAPNLVDDVPEGYFVLDDDDDDDDEGRGQTEGGEGGEGGEGDAAGEEFDWGVYLR